MFVTLALAVVDPFSGRLTVASAGHPLPIVRDASGLVSPIGRTGGIALGLDPRAVYREFVYEMDAGDAVVLYTDGVSEARSPRNELYGPERLVKLITSAPADVGGLGEAILADVRHFADGRPMNDDLTLVCFARTR